MEANQRLLSLGLQPSPSGLDTSHYRKLAEQDPNRALAGLWIEIDIVARNLAKGFEIDLEPGESGVRLLRKLFDSGAITSEQMRLIQKILQLSNAPIHGQPVTLEEAEDLIDVADILAEQYICWLSWGFEDKWTPTTLTKSELKE